MKVTGDNQGFLIAKIAITERLGLACPIETFDPNWVIERLAV
jgi:hypothetical protein